MNHLPRPRAALAAALATALLALAACGGGSAGSPAMAPTAAPAAEARSGDFAAPAAAPTMAPAATAQPLLPIEAAPTAQLVGAGGAAGAPGAQAAPPASDPGRKIIKDAQMQIEVASVDLAISRINGVAAQAGGYVLETSTSYASAADRGAVVRIAVPVDQFEATLQRLREGAARIISEQASGVDATQEFVDIQSQIANLEATQARVRQFLDQAKTVEEALKVNARLTEIDGQLSQLKGRIQFLSQRAAYSTITVQLSQTPPTPTVTPTPSPTRTPEPLFNPQKTTEQATTTLVTILQAAATVVLWLAIVGVPLAIPFVLVWLVVRATRRRKPPEA